jgi:hypothetical protein
MTQEMEDKPLQEWVDENVANVGKKPLFVISANLQKNVRRTMEHVCSKEDTECIDGNAVLNSKKLAGDYGFPDGNRLKSNKRLLIELATCAMASDVYLPNSQKKIINGQELKAMHAHLFQSTMSDLIATMAKSGKMKSSLKKAKKEAKKEAKKASNLAMVYVANKQLGNCKCMATQLNESPYQVTRLQAVTPATMATECYAKKGTKNADKMLRSQKCTQYNTYKLAYEKSQAHNNTYSLIFEDDAIIKKPAFWEQVDKYLNSPCQSWDLTSVDISKGGEPIKADSFGRNTQMCSWGAKTSQEAIYPKVGAGTHMQIIRNSAIPRMLKYMEEEEKRDLPMDSLVNHFGNVVGWYPEIAAQKGAHLLNMAWKSDDAGCTESEGASMAFDCPKQ